jgi:hypothetical protein
VGYKTNGDKKIEKMKIITKAFNKTESRAPSRPLTAIETADMLYLSGSPKKFAPVNFGVMHIFRIALPVI